MERVQVFDWLEMPPELSDEVLAFYEARNDSYNRFYPCGESMEKGLRDSVTKWMINEGMEIEDGKYFHVLIFISW